MYSWKQLEKNLFNFTSGSPELLQKAGLTLRSWQTHIGSLVAETGLRLFVTSNITSASADNSIRLIMIIHFRLNVFKITFLAGPFVFLFVFFMICLFCWRNVALWHHWLLRLSAVEACRSRKVACHSKIWRTPNLNQQTPLCIYCVWTVFSVRLRFSYSIVWRTCNFILNFNLVPHLKPFQGW